MAFMGVDIGTTGSKAIIINSDGNILSKAYRDYPLSFPHSGWAELDPVQVWDAVKSVMQEAVSKSQEPVQTIAVSALGEAVTPVDQNGKPLDQTIIAMDSRAEQECQWLGENIGAETLYQITGQPLHPMYSLNKILWWKNNKPDVFDKTWKFLCWQDYAAYLLCGEAVIDFSLASRTWLFDLRKKHWNQEILEKTGLRAEQLAIPKQSGEIIGTILPHIRSELGLPNNCQLVCGGFDQPSAALGAGVISPGIAVDGMGTVECITPVSESPITNQILLRGNIPCCPHVIPDLYIFMGFNFCCGSLLQWFANEFSAEERLEAETSGNDVYDIIIQKAMQVQTDALLLPHFLGSGTPHLDPHSRGAIAGLDLNTNRHQVARAVLEGITYEMKQNLDLFRESGVNIEILRATGGASKSPEWTQLKADIFNIPIVSLNTSEGGCLGMAMTAGVASGGFSSLQEAIDVCIQFGNQHKPNEKNQLRHVNRYKIYQDLYDSLKDVHHLLSS